MNKYIKGGLKVLLVIAIGLSIGFGITYADKVKEYYQKKTSKTYYVSFSTPKAIGSTIITQKKKKYPDVESMKEVIGSKYKKMYGFPATSTIQTPVITNIIRIK